MNWHNIGDIKDVLCDKKLSLNAKGLFIILNRLVAPFECTKNEIKEYCNNDESDIRSAMLELVAYGYISKDYLDYYNGEK